MKQVLSPPVKSEAALIEAAVKRARATTVDDDLPIYQQMVKEFGNPDRAALVAKQPRPSRSVRAEIRRTTGKLTHAVWNSLLPDGTVDPAKMVPAAVVNTTELPTLESKPAPATEA